MNVLHAIDSRGRLFALLVDFLKAYQDRTEALKGTPPIGDTSIGQKLDAILETQKSLTISVADLPFIKLELGTVHELVFQLQQFNGKVETFMATQEERLQAILVAVKNVKQMLADLKASNPAIEDEIKAIEDELAPAPEPEPSPEG